MSDDVHLSIVIPTYNRPDLLRRAVAAALAQTAQGVEVVVVDDASPEPVRPEDFPGVRVIRQPENAGISAARNAGVRAARGRWVGFCDDDDELLPHYAKVSLDAAEASDLERPIAVLSGLANVTPEGRVKHEHFPPTLPKGKHFWMEDLPPGASDLSKQTLIVERDVLLAVGGFDEEIKGREWTDLMPRLNAACGIVGVDAVTYRRLIHAGPRVSTAAGRRQLNFDLVVDRHRDLLAAHPRGHARFLYEHAYTSWQIGQRGPALRAFAKAMRVKPTYTLGRAGGQALRIAGGLLRGKPPGQG